MRSLDTARDTCEQHHPGLLKALGDIDLLTREQPGSPVIDLFRSHDGGALLVPAGFGGQGADPLEAVRVMRALGAASPSLGAAATMHHFMAATLFAIAAEAGTLTEAQSGLLSRIGPDRLLLASGWAEGRTGQNILIPSVVAQPAEGGGYLVSGSKKPCSLSRSMDVLTASVILPDEDGTPSLAVLMLPADSPGISVHPFWSSSVLAAAESDEVRLVDVRIGDDLVLRPDPRDPAAFANLLMTGFVWFELLISSVYLGAASALVERVLSAGRGSVTDRATLGIRLESTVGLIEGIARSLGSGLEGDETVASTLVARFAAQEALAGVADLAVELLGGMAFVSSSEVAYLAAAVRPLAFHPPSRTSTAESLVEYFNGGPLALA